MKNNKCLRNILATTSALSIITLISNGAFGAPAARTVGGGGAYDLTSGVNLNGGVIFTNGSVLEIQNAQNGDTGAGNYIIGAIDTHGQNLTGKTLTINNGQNLTLGVVVDRNNDGLTLRSAADAKTANSLYNIKLAGPDTLTINGNTVLPILFSTNGVVGNTIPAKNNYSALGQIDLGNNAARLTVNAGDTNEITLPNVTFLNNNNAILDVETSLILNSNSGTGFNIISISEGKTLTYDVDTNLDFKTTTPLPSLINFKGANSTLAMKIDASGGAKTITFYSDLDTHAGAGTDNSGKLIFKVTGGALTIDGNGPQDLGKGPANRLNNVAFLGDDNITLSGDINLYSKAIEVGMTAGTLTFANAINSGADSTLTFTADNATVAFGNNATIGTLDFAANTNASVKLAGDFTGSIDSTVGVGGTLIIEGASTVDGAIGATNALKAVTFDAGGGTAINLGNGNAVKATNFIFLNADIVTANGPVEGEIDFANTAGAFIIGGANITGDILSTGGTNGELFFNAVATTVTGDIGTGVDKVNFVQIFNGKSATINGLFNAGAVEIGEVGGGGNLTLRANNQLIDNIYDFNHADSNLSLKAVNAGSTFKLSDHIESGTLAGTIVFDTTEGNITVDAVGGAKTLGTMASPFAVFDVIGGRTVTVTADVDLSNTAALNIKSGTLIDTNGASLAIADITIGNNIGNTEGNLVIAGTGNLNITSNIIFDHEDSSLELRSVEANREFTLTRNIDVSDDNKGMIILNTLGAGKKITLKSDGVAVRTIGAVGHKINELIIASNLGAQVTIDGNVAGNTAVDISKINVLTLGGTSKLIAETASIGNIPEIFIGVDLTPLNFGGGAAPATLIIDAVNDNINLNTDFIFSDENSVLTLQNTALANKTFTLSKNIEDPTNTYDNFGIVEVKAHGANITIDGVGTSIGSNPNMRVKELKFIGANTSTIDVATFAKEVSVTLGDATFTKAVHTGNDGIINIGDAGAAKTATFKDDVTSNRINFLHADAIFKVEKDGATITATDYFKGNGNSVGKVEVKGAGVIFDTNLGSSGNALKELKITTNEAGGGAGSATINAYKKVFATNTILEEEESKLLVSNQVEITSAIDGGANDRGILEFDTGADGVIEVTGNIGNTHSVKKIKLLGKGLLKIHGGLKTKTIEFGASNEVLTVDNDLIITAGGSIKTLGTNFTNTIQLSGDFNTQGTSVGEAGHEINIVLFNDSTVTIGGDNNFYAKVITGNNELGKVVFNNAAGNAISYDLGDENKALKQITFTENGKVKGSAFAKNIEVAAGKKASFEGNLNEEEDLSSLSADFSGKKARVNTYVIGNEFKLAGAGSEGIFNAGTILNADVVTGVNEQGKLKFGGDVAIYKQIGSSDKRLEKIEFTSGSDAYLMSDIFAKKGAAASAKSINVSGTNIVLVNDVNIDGDLKGTGTTLSIGKAKLTYEGKAMLDGAVILNVAGRKSTLGQIYVQGSKSELDLSSATSMNVKFKGDSDSNVFNKKFVILAVDKGEKIKAPTINTNFIDEGDSSAYVRWSYDPATYTLTAQNIREEVQDRSYSKELASEIDILFDNVSPGSDAAEYELELGRIHNISIPAVAEAVGRLNPITATPAALSQMSSEVMGATVNSVTSTITGRINQLTSPEANIDVSESRGVAAGDEVTSYGIWSNFFQSSAAQGTRGSRTGYKAKTGGITLGFDTQANDDLLVGAAYTFADASLTHKKPKTGDKTRANTHMFTIYALQHLPQSFFIQGLASFGSTSIKNSETRLYANTARNSIESQTAIGKYESTSYNIEATAGYSLEANKNMIITPILGIRYSHFNDAGYTEEGTTSTNYTIGKKSANKLDGILGGKVNFVAQFDNGVTLKPEIHTYINQHLAGKDPKVDARLDGQITSRIKQPEKSTKTFFNVGTSLTANYKMMEYGIGYDAHFAKKYVSHQGTLKIRVNF